MYYFIDFYHELFVFTATGQYFRPFFICLTIWIIYISRKWAHSHFSIFFSSLIFFQSFFLHSMFLLIRCNCLHHYFIVCHIVILYLLEKAYIGNANYVIIRNNKCLKLKKSGRIKYEVCKNRLLETFYVYMSSKRR